MIRSLWISKTGLDAQQTHLDTISNNLANASTNGYKKHRPIFEDLLYQTIRQPGSMTTQQTQYPTGLQMGTGVRVVANERIFTQGSLNQTENAKDIAINGIGFFQISMPDGTIGYTRDGAFQTDNQGQLVTAEGYLMSPPITIPADAIKLHISRDGIVSVTMQDQIEPVEIGNIQLASFINPAGLESVGENLFMETAASGVPMINVPGENGSGNLWQGFLENANVSVVEELVNMIKTQRTYEINSKVVSTSDQMLAKLAQL